MSSPQPTTERLAAALEAINAPYVLIAHARAGHYDDYKSELPFPQIVLVGELQKLGTNGAMDLARQVIAGEFDGTKEEAEAWAASPEGQQALREMDGLEP